MEPITPKAVQLRSGPVSYRQLGEGPPLLLLHGWGASSRYWLPTLAALSTERRMIAPDLPGFGETPALAQPATVAGLAALAIELADALGLEQFDLAGHSFGGSVAAVVAATAPKRVRRLALVSFGVYGEPLARTLLGMAQAPAALTLGLWYPLLTITSPLRDMARPLVAELLSAPPVAQALARWYLERAPEDQGLLREGMRDLAGMDLRAHLACLASIGDPAVAAALEQIAAPALLIAGRQDRVMPQEAVRGAAALLARAEQAVLEDCGHVPMFEQPAAFHAALRAFLLAET